MKATTEEILEMSENWKMTDDSVEEITVILSGEEPEDLFFIAGYRTAEAKAGAETARLTAMVKKLEDALRLIDCMDVNPKTTDMAPMQIYISIVRGVASKAIAEIQDVSRG